MTSFNDLYEKREVRTCRYTFNITKPLIATFLLLSGTVCSASATGGCSGKTFPVTGECSGKTQQPNNSLQELVFPKQAPESFSEGSCSWGRVCCDSENIEVQKSCCFSGPTVDGIDRKLYQTSVCFTAPAKVVVRKEKLERWHHDDERRLSYQYFNIYVETTPGVKEILKEGCLDKPPMFHKATTTYKPDRTGIDLSKKLVRINVCKAYMRPGDNIAYDEKIERTENIPLKLEHVKFKDYTNDNRNGYSRQILKLSYEENGVGGIEKLLDQAYESLEQIPHKYRIVAWADDDSRLQSVPTEEIFITLVNAPGLSSETEERVVKTFNGNAVKYQLVSTSEKKNSWVSSYKIEKYKRPGRKDNGRTTGTEDFERTVWLK